VATTAALSAEVGASLIQAVSPRRQASGGADRIKLIA
jgi:hypothetical protein